MPDVPPPHYPSPTAEQARAEKEARTAAYTEEKERLQAALDGRGQRMVVAKMRTTCAKCAKVAVGALFVVFVAADSPQPPPPFLLFSPFILTDQRGGWRAPSVVRRWWSIPRSGDIPSTKGLTQVRWVVYVESHGLMMVLRWDPSLKLLLLPPPPLSCRHHVAQAYAWSEAMTSTTIAGGRTFENTVGYATFVGRLVVGMRCRGWCPTSSPP